MESFITRREAADILNVSLGTLDRMVRTGQLRGHYRDGDKLPTLSAREVAEFSELRARRPTAIEVAAMARSAYVASLSVERKIDQLCELLGANLPALSRNEEDVLSLAAEIDDMLEQEFITPDVSTLMRWARTFMSVDQAYLEVVAQHTGSDEPWKRLSELAARLSGLPVGDDPALRQASQYMRVGIRAMEGAMYAHARRVKGPRFADKVFNSSFDHINNRILSVMLFNGRV